MTPSNPRFARSLVQPVHDSLSAELAPLCRRFVAAGSWRRGRETVGDLEFVYVPKPPTVRKVPGELFAEALLFEVDDVIHCLLDSGILKLRLNQIGRTTFGGRNKLLSHCSTGCPIDLFSIDEAGFHNYLVCRTGPAALNIAISVYACRSGLAWHPYGSGFTCRSTGKILPCPSEEAVFAAVGLPYIPPSKRDLVATIFETFPPASADATAAVRSLASGGWDPAWTLGSWLASA